MDDGTQQRQFLRGLSPGMQKAWGQDNSQFGTISEMAIWAIEKECRLATLKNVTSGKQTEARQPRRDNGTFKPATTAQGGDAMDLDATRRSPRLNLSNNEYKRRRDNNLCLGCARPGHMLRNCRSPRNSSDGGIQSRQQTPAKPTWQRRSNIREIRIDADEEGAVKDEGLQH